MAYGRTFYEECVHGFVVAIAKKSPCDNAGSKTTYRSTRRPGDACPIGRPPALYAI